MAAALGVSEETLRELSKKAPAFAAPVKIEKSVRFSEEAVSWMAREIGLLHSDGQGVGGFSWPNFLEKLRAGGQSAAALATVVESMAPQKTAVASLSGTVLAQCPNPLFFRVQAGRRVVVLKEARPSMRDRIKPQVTVTLWPVAGQTYYTLVNPNQ